MWTCSPNDGRIIPFGCETKTDGVERHSPDRRLVIVHKIAREMTNG